MNAIMSDVEVFDKDGVQILWRSVEDLRWWLEGKPIKTVTNLETMKEKGTVVVTEIHILEQED